MFSYEVLFFLVVLFQNLSMVVYADLVGDYKYNKILTMIGFFLVETITYVATIPIINLKLLKLLIITMVQIGAFKVLFDSDWKKALKQGIILVVFILLSEILADPLSMLVARINHQRLDVDNALMFDTLRVMGGCLCFVVQITLFLLYSMFKRKTDKIIKRKLIPIIIMIPLVFWLFYFILYEYNIETFTTKTLWFIFIIGVILSFSMIATYKLLLEVQEISRSKIELDYLKEKEQYMLDYYNLMKDKEADMRKIGHDIRNNLQVISSLKNEDKKEKIIKDITEKLSSSEIKKYSDSEILNIILNLKLKEAKNKEIKLNIEIKNSLKDIEDIDISNLFSNILDNAIENIGNKKIIDLKIYKKMNYIVIKCSNTYRKEVTMKEGLHGYGLKIIEDIVNKYEGELKINKTNDKYEIVIMLATD